jgi:hypothetical protein
MAEELPDSARRVQQALMTAGISARVLQLPQSARNWRACAPHRGITPTSLR